MNKGILIIYNTCSIGWDKTPRLKSLEQWKKDLMALKMQDFPYIQIVVTECRGPGHLKWASGKHYIEYKKWLTAQNIPYINVDEYMPFGQSVNHAVKTMIQANGRYEYYMYWSSGFECKTHPDGSETDNQILSNIYTSLQENTNVCRANLFASNDNKPSFEYLHDNANKSLHIMTPGQAINDHCSIYSDFFVKSYDDCIRPDIYKGNGSEACFPYMAAAIGKKCAVIQGGICPPLIHHRTLDGKNPGIKNRMDKWYIKTLDSENGDEYLNAEEIEEKTTRCIKAGILMNTEGQILVLRNGQTYVRTDPKDRSNKDSHKFVKQRYGKAFWEGNTIDQNNLQTFIKKEFFVQGFDYKQIKASYHGIK